MSVFHKTNLFFVLSRKVTERNPGLHLIWVSVRFDFNWFQLILFGFLWCMVGLLVLLIEVSTHVKRPKSKITHPFMPCQTKSKKENDCVFGAQRKPFYFLWFFFCFSCSMCSTAINSILDRSIFENWRKMKENGHTMWERNTKYKIFVYTMSVLYSRTNGKISMEQREQKSDYTVSEMNK